MKPINTTFFIGHNAIEQTFLNAFKNGTLSHAYLLSGPRGIGKETFAYRATRFLFENGLNKNNTETTLDLPSTSTLSSRMESGGLTDLCIIEKEDGKMEISVEAIKNLNQFLSLTSAENTYRIVIINSIDALNRNSANAVLKMLEEPPINTVFFLISHQKSNVLPTIKSRCQEFIFHPLTNDEMNDALIHYCPDISNLNRTRIINAAQGSLGQAIEIANGAELLNDLDFVQEDLRRGKEETLMPFIKKVIAIEAEQTIFTILLGQIKDINIYNEMLTLIRQTQSLKLDKESVLMIVLKKITT